MNLIISLLTRLGLINGHSLDGAIKLLTKLDAHLEKVEALEKAKSEAADLAASKAALDKATADDNAARAARIRDRAKEFVS